MARTPKHKSHSPKSPKKTNPSSHGKSHPSETPASSRLAKSPSLEAGLSASSHKSSTERRGWDGWGLSWLDGLVVVGLVLLIGWVFWGSLGGETLKWDDNKYLNPQENRVLRGGWSGLWAAWSSMFDSSWYPVLQTWFWLASQIAAWLDVPLLRVIKVGNGLLTLAGAVCFLRILVVRVGVAPLLACVLLGGVWLHPLRVESFAWASNARDTMSLFFLLWSLDAYLRGARVWGMWALLAALSKTSVVLVPLCFPLFAHLLESGRQAQQHPRSAPQRGMRGVVVWAVIAVILLAVGVAGYKDVAARNCALEEGWAGHIGTVACVQARYVARIISLTPPVAIPTVPWSCGWGWIQAVCFLGWVGLGGLALVLRKGAGRWVSVGVAWWFCAMLPIAGVIPIAFPIADRYTLLPMIGMALVCGAWFASLAREREAFALPHRSWLLWFALSCVVGMGIYTQRAVPIWQSDAQLWSYNARMVPNEWAVFLNLGGTAGGKGDFVKARSALERAWLLAPHRYLVLQSLFLARAVVLEPKVGVSLHQAFLFARNDREKLKQMLMSPYIYRHAPLISLIRFRIKSLDNPPTPKDACREERESRWRLHPDHPHRTKRSLGSL